MIGQREDTDFYAVLDGYLVLFEQLEQLQEQLHEARQIEDAGAIARIHASIDQVDGFYQAYRDRWSFPLNPRVSWPVVFGKWKRKSL